jgi:hypothetical protein
MIRDFGCCLGVFFLLGCVKFVLGCGFGCLKFGMGGFENCLNFIWICNDLVFDLFVFWICIFF